MSDIEIEIDGKKLQAKPDAMVMQVADAAGIYIPRFCYHKHLSIAANCRMCLVEVEKAPKPLPACATPVMPGMKVFTRSSIALAAQRAVMEFLLINHPLDCPICDQGGECELQDLSMGFGKPESFYCEGKRVVKDKDLGPLISSEMTRCIQCTRCVRFGSEVAGFPELGATGRGENMEIGTYVQHAMQSELSGNIIDLCPVGALTSKPFRFTARAWELIQHPSIAPHDCAGSHIFVHTRNGSVMRVVPQENKAINQTWLSDRDRFSYEGLLHEDRLERPQIRVGNVWQETDWQTAFEFALQGLQKVFNKHGVEQFAALASPSCTLEEFYLLQKLTRAIGSPHIDHRLRQVDFTDQQDFAAFPGLNMPLAEIEDCDAIILIGSNIQKEQPIVSLRVRKASLKGASIIAINMMQYEFHFKTAMHETAAPHEFVAALTRLLNDTTVLDLLKEKKKIAILLGAQALHHPEASSIRAAAQQAAVKLDAAMGYLTEGSNTAGAWLAGAIPHRGPAGATVASIGLNAQTVWQEPRKAYLLQNLEADLDTANPVAAANALDQAEFVVVLSPFKNSWAEQYGHVILPVTPFTETSGTYVNVNGEWQSFKGVTSPFSASRPAWKVLRVLANFLHLPGFEYESSEEVRHEIKHAVDNMPNMTERMRGLHHTKKDYALSRIGEIPLYSEDSLVRRSKSLQTAQTIMEGNLISVRLHPITAEKLKLREGEPVIVKQYDGRARLPAIFDERVPENAAYIAGALPLMSGLSELFGPIEIEKG